MRPKYKKKFKADVMLRLAMYTYMHIQDTHIHTGIYEIYRVFKQLNFLAHSPRETNSKMYTT